MKHVRRVINYCVVIALLITSLFSVQASAVGMSSSQTFFPLTVPLMVTSYQTNLAGTDFQFVELYNNGSTPVKLTDFIIRDMTSGNSERTLLFQSNYDGLLLPDTHIILSAVNGVDGATFQLTGWDKTLPNPVAVKSLKIERNGYRPFETGLLVSSETVNRTVGVSGYTTTTTSGAYAVNYRKSSSAYSPAHQLFDDGLYEAPVHPGISIVEVYPYASDCSPFDDSVLCGDYIKLYNPTAAIVLLDDIVLRSDSSSSSPTASNTFTLTGVMAPGEYKTVWLTDTNGRISLTNSGGYLWLEDSYGLVSPYPDTMVRYESAGSTLQGYAYAQDTEGLWQWTSTPQPTGENIITTPVAAACPEGKYRNPDTGRCRTLEETINALAACQEGYKRNPITNRCRKVAVTGSSNLTPCKEGQERNPATNRCRSIASAVAALLPCDEGYERNPATNRCRKVRDNEVLAAEYPVQPYDQGQSATITWWAVGGIGTLALGYAGWEWRREIAAGLARIRGKLLPS